MCGIIGVSGDFNELIFKRAGTKISHRGPDDSGFYFDASRNVALGHFRLSVIDPSSSAGQPFCSDDGNVILVFNGEIYNYKDLRDELKCRGFDFKTNSDTEVLMNLYIADNVNMLSKLQGIFSFAIWDSKLDQIFLARDGLGVKPLYYLQENGDFCFSSEIKSLICFIKDKKVLDYYAIKSYISYLSCPGERTPLNNIKKVHPGEVLIVRNGNITRRWSWYKLPILNGIRPKLGKKASIDGVRNRLRNAVRSQMVADVPVGAFLSGGLDSSAIVAFARDVDPSIECFTIDSYDDRVDEVNNDLIYAKHVASHLNVQLQVVKVSSDNVVDDLEHMIYQLDEPLADPAALNVMYISKLAKERGIKVLLSGAGGDDLFTGYRRHLAVKLDKYWRWLPHGVISGLENYSKRMSVSHSFQRKLAKLLDGATLDKDSRLANYLRWTSDATLKSLFSNDYKRHIEFDKDDDVMNFLRMIPAAVSDEERMLALDQRFFLTDHNLNYTDKMSMSVGLEVRVPFLDYELIDFAAQIPVKYKQHGLIGKWVLKKAMEPILPRDVIYRKKVGFGVPLRRWIKQDLSELINDLLSVESVNNRGLFSPKGVRQLISDNQVGKIDASYTLFSLLCIELWCRKFIDNYN